MKDRLGLLKIVDESIEELKQRNGQAYTLEAAGIVIEKCKPPGILPGWARPLYDRFIDQYVVKSNDEKSGEEMQLQLTRGKIGAKRPNLILLIGDTVIERDLPSGKYEGFDIKNASSLSNTRLFPTFWKAQKTYAPFRQYIPKTFTLAFGNPHMPYL